jgi:hypothetical protein
MSEQNEGDQKEGTEKGVAVAPVLLLPQNPKG